MSPSLPLSGSLSADRGPRPPRRESPPPGARSRGEARVAAVTSSSLPESLARMHEALYTESFGQGARAFATRAEVLAWLTDS